MKEKMPEPTGVNELLIFSLDNFDQDKFDGLSDGLKDIIKKSAEWRGTNGEEEANKAVSVALADIDSDMPF
jgi:hypothetical protein